MVMEQTHLKGILLQVSGESWTPTTPKKGNHPVASNDPRVNPPPITCTSAADDIYLDQFLETKTEIAVSTPSKVHDVMKAQSNEIDLKKKTRVKLKKKRQRHRPKVEVDKFKSTPKTLTPKHANVSKKSVEKSKYVRKNNLKVSTQSEDVGTNEHNTTTIPKGGHHYVCENGVHSCFTESRISGPNFPKNKMKTRSGRKRKSFSIHRRYMEKKKCVMKSLDVFGCMISLCHPKPKAAKRSTHPRRRRETKPLAPVPCCNELLPSHPKQTVEVEGNEIKVSNGDRAFEDVLVIENLEKRIMIRMTEKVETSSIVNAVTHDGENKGLPCEDNLLAVVPTGVLETDNIDSIIQKMKSLRIKDEGKKGKIKAEVDLDLETSRRFKLLLGNEGGSCIDEEDEDTQRKWEKVRKLFSGRVHSFTARMQCILGNKCFSPWKGSVVDSICGVFLTQNVSDQLSSSAFMSLAARFPHQPTTNHKTCDKDEEIINIQASTKEETEMINSQEPVGSSTEVGPEYNLQELFGSEIKADKTCESEENNIKNMNKSTQETEAELVASKISEDASYASQSHSSAPFMHPLSSRKDKKKLKVDKETIVRRKKDAVKKDENIDWDAVRISYSQNKEKDRPNERMDSVDWEAVRSAPQEMVADAIKARGQNNILAGRIQEFLNRIVKDHGSIDLEWLRDVPANKSKAYLLSINGLGLKSVECVRLLSLQQLAFPVDINVARITVRLGWVPLRPLPGDLHIHLLNDFPDLEQVQRYLWPRLCTLSVPTLYMLHYVLITFGKVFCTKSKPNCNQCPMRGECLHFASAAASTRHALPGPQQKSIDNFLVPNAMFRTQNQNVSPVFPLLEGIPFFTSEIEPIIEEPASPEPERESISGRDIEDYFADDSDEIPTIILNTEEFTKNLNNYGDMSNLISHDGDISNAMVALTSRAASFAMPKLKNVSRLRTVHQAYVLRDTHRHLLGFEELEPDDPGSYLLIIWTPGMIYS